MDLKSVAGYISYHVCPSHNLVFSAASQALVSFIELKTELEKKTDSKSEYGSALYDPSSLPLSTKEG